MVFAQALLGTTQLFLWCPMCLKSKHRNNSMVPNGVCSNTTGHIETILWYNN